MIHVTYIKLYKGVACWPTFNLHAQRLNLVRLLVLFPQSAHIWRQLDVELSTDIIDILFHYLFPIDIDEILFAMICVSQGPWIVNLEQTLTFNCLLDVPWCE